MKRKTNLKRIMSRYNREYFWQGVLWLSLILMLMTVYLRYSSPLLLVSYLLVGLVCGFIGMLIIVLIVSLIRKAILKSTIRKQGDLQSFNEEEFMEIGYSKHFFVSDNWLVWNRGDHYRIFNRNHILGVNPHPAQRADNRYGVCDLYADTMKKSINLYYEKADNVDLPGMIQGWLHGYSENAVNDTLISGVYDTFAQNTAPAQKICQACMAPNDPNASFCGYCGSPLK